MLIEKDRAFIIAGLLNEIRRQERTDEPDGDLIVKILTERIEYNAGIIKMLDDMYQEHVIKLNKIREERRKPCNK